MTLAKYKSKRDFRATPEPAGREAAARKAPAGPLRFVVQKHAAGRLHYDFRLELDGALKSWAVPKGPSMNPREKRLAVAVEDHPLEYRTFEGTIPEGSYGAGEVIVWDEGTYRSADSRDPAGGADYLRKGLQEGNLRFIMDGRKLKGAFVLVRTRGMGRKESWLLMKKKDEYATTQDVLEQGASVRSGATLNVPGKRPAAGKSRLKASGGQQKKPAAQRRSSAGAGQTEAQRWKPMLARLVKEPFDDPDWLFETKWDGYRASAEIHDGRAELYSRRGNSFNERYAPVVRALQSLRADAVLDGEVVAMDARGRSGFQLLQNYQKTGKGRLVYCVFDLLALDGRDLTSLPLLERKNLLKKLLPRRAPLRYSDHILGKGKAALDAARRKQLEGIIAKKIRSPYRPGERTDEWLKIKTHMRQEAVIGGFTEPKGSRKHLGALVLGVYEGDRLVYAGQMGGGFNRTSLKEMRERLEPLIRKDPPFAVPPREKSPITWVDPVLVCEVTFSEWTSDGIFRQPIFTGLREDKNPREVVREGFSPG